ncbi:MAG TPA: oxaloacetate decarboxylase [Gammaproteobacteria bacterium]|nr:oxaloacetate decarboxylase [Gammaproteobacteria bacterium]
MANVQKMRQLLNSKKIQVAPGVYDGLSGLLAKQAGFSVLYASGGAIARSAGYPDLGLLTLTEITTQVSSIVRATDLPVIADADTGFGNAINVARTVREFENIGVAGIHIEDQTFPKRCGHLDDKTLISKDEMCHKIKTAKETKQNPDFLIIARTDAIGAENFDSAIDRALAYQKAGADMIFVEAPTSLSQIEEVAKKISGFKLINMFHGGKTPDVPLKTLEALGFNLVIIPSDLQRACIKAMQKTLAVLHTDGNSLKINTDLTSFSEREKILDTAKYLQL